MSTPSFDLREEAESLWLLYAMGMIAFTEIVNWADTKIRLMSDPPISIIDLALLKHPTWIEVQRAIAELPGECDFQRVGFEALARVRDAYFAGEFGLESALQRLKAFFSWARLREDVWWAFDRVDDDHWLEKDGVWAAGAADKSLRVFLKQYTRDFD